MPRFLLLLLALPALAQPPGTVESFLDMLNGALNANESALAFLFTPNAEYRIGDHTVATGPNAIAEALTPAPFREQTRPRLEHPSSIPLSSEFRLVRADLVRYGAVIPKSTHPVLLLLTNTAAGWRIASWFEPVGPLRLLPARIR